MQNTNKCKSCAIEAEWRTRYLIAEKRFDKALRQAEIITLFAVVTAMICFFSCLFFGMKVMTFINNFEYVEETTYTVQQDDKGTNTAFLGGERYEVNIYGSEDNRKEEKVLAEEN